MWRGGVGSGVGNSSWLFILSYGAGIHWRQTLGYRIVSFVLNTSYKGLLLSGSLSVLMGRVEKRKRKKERERGGVDRRGG